MDLDPKDVVEEARSASSGRLNAVVAVTVAILATFMGICKVKDDNIVQAMQQAQADKLDHWAFYQARNWHAFEGEVYCEQPDGRIRFEAMAPFVFDIRRAPRQGVMDLKGLPW